MDLNIKIIFFFHFQYVLYFAELSSGRIGAAQHGKCCTYFVIAVLVISVFVSIIGLIFVIR